MQWDIPQHNDERIIKGFAFLPIEADEIVKWLETVKIMQRYDSYRRKWVNRYFVK
jgi:hypothetical protein